MNKVLGRNFSKKHCKDCDKKVEDKNKSLDEEIDTNWKDFIDGEIIDDLGGHAIVKNDDAYLVWAKHWNRPVSRLGANNEYIAMKFDTEDEARDYYNKHFGKNEELKEEMLSLKKIKKLIAPVYHSCEEWLKTTSSMENQDAYTDRMIEEIIDNAKKLEQAYEGQFKKESLENFNDVEDFRSALYDAMKKVVRRFANKGATLKDLESDVEFCLLHMADDEEIPQEVKEESLKEDKEDSKEEPKLETFDEQMDFLAADEQEAIDGYDKVLALVDDEHVKEQLNKILVEEKAHKEFLEKVKEDKTLEYYHEEHEEEKKEDDVKEEPLGDDDDMGLDLDVGMEVIDLDDIDDDFGFDESLNESQSKFNRVMNILNDNETYHESDDLISYNEPEAIIGSFNLKDVKDEYVGECELDINFDNPSDDDFDKFIKAANGEMSDGFNFDIMRNTKDNLKKLIDKYADDIIDIYDESLKEDTVKKGNKWVNKGKDGEHGEFKTKKEADAQRKAMFANGYHEEYDDDFGCNYLKEEEAEEFGITVDWNDLDDDIEDEHKVCPKCHKEPCECLPEDDKLEEKQIKTGHIKLNKPIELKARQ